VPVSTGAENPVADHLMGMPDEGATTKEDHKHTQPQVHPHTHVIETGSTMWARAAGLKDGKGAVYVRRQGFPCLPRAHCTRKTQRPVPTPPPALTKLVEQHEALNARQRQELLHAGINLGWAACWLSCSLLAVNACSGVRGNKRGRWGGVEGRGRARLQHRHRALSWVMNTQQRLFLSALSRLPWEQSQPHGPCTPAFRQQQPTLAAMIPLTKKPKNENAAENAS
jgi:hypothetical protein